MTGIPKYLRIHIPVLLALIQVTSAIGSTHPQPGHKRSIPVSQISELPQIDGSLDEKAWGMAATSGDFWLVDEKRSPTDRTEVLVISDGKTLFFGFRCYDSQPEAIYSPTTRRDAGLGYEDLVSVELDSFLDYRSVSTYSVNVNGTQDDAIAGGRARKIEWKGDWQAAATRTDYGWSAELAIPFTTLNYNVDAHEFGVNFVRYQHRTNEWSYWADVTPQYLNEEMGQLIGLDLPNTARNRPWTVMPYALAGVNVPDIEGEVENELASIGADIRYEPRSNITALFSLNPDFSQLETQVTDIDFSYSEKFRDDPRPFFQEGSAYFGSDQSYFYSIRVPDFHAGAKSFAQWEKDEDSLLSSGQIKVSGFITGAPDDRRDGLMHIEREIGARHGIGMMLVATEREDLDNQLLVVQANSRLESGFFYALDAAHSNTQRQAFNEGDSYLASTGWQNDNWLLSLDADYYDIDYFPANGLLADDLYGTRNTGVSTSYYRDLYGGFFRAVDVGIDIGDRETLSGQDQYQYLYVSGGVEFPKQIRLDLEYSDGDYRPGIGVRGQFSNTVNQDHYWGMDLNFNTRSSVFATGLYYADGFLAGDDYRYLTTYVWGKPTQNTVLSLSAERLENFGITEQVIINGGWDITSEDGIVARIIWLDGDTYERLAYRRTVRSGMDFFAVFDQTPGADAQITMKAVWTIR